LNIRVRFFPFLILLLSPLLQALPAVACPDFRGIYLRSDPTGQYQIRVEQDDCESVEMTILRGPYGNGVPFRRFQQRPLLNSNPALNPLGFESIGAAILADSLILLRSSAQSAAGQLTLARNSEVYRMLPDGRLSVELYSLAESFPSGQKDEHNDLQVWTRMAY